MSHLADIVFAIRALAKFDISQNDLYAAGTKAIAEALKDNQTLTELGISSNDMDLIYGVRRGEMSGIIALAGAIPTMGAMVKFDVSSNNLRAEGGKALGEALKDNQVLQELNVAGNMLIYKADANSEADTDMAGVIAISNAIPTMGAMTSLNISNNQLNAEGAKHIAAALPECK